MRIPGSNNGRVAIGGDTIGLKATDIIKGLDVGNCPVGIAKLERIIIIFIIIKKYY
jgi:hypothetical protein